jgi:hypothetical protein
MDWHGSYGVTVFAFSSTLPRVPLLDGRLQVLQNLFDAMRGIEHAHEATIFLYLSSSHWAVYFDL